MGGTTNKSWKTWTVKELDRLEAMRLEGRTAAAIAEQLGRTVASVKSRIAAEGFSRISRSKSRWLDELTKPHTIAGLAAKLGVTKWAVKRAKDRLKKNGIEVVPCR